jgi:Zn-dependent peptidase ImmA (M78 family)/DNA-binding XRE family transcriptional regulator
MTKRGSPFQLPVFGGGGGEFRDRVKRLRLLRRWDQSKLAQRATISTSAVSQIETGQVSPTSDQIAAIGSALGYSPEFLTAELNLVPTTRPWLRAYADASRREADARTAAASIATEYIRRLSLAPLPDLIPYFADEPDDEDVLDDAAAELRELAGLDSDSVVGNVIRAAERLGCVVLPLESELGRHLGMSVRSDQIPMVCVAKGGVPGDRQRFTVAHELGHLMLHGQTSPPRDSNEASRLERQANRFAAAFLGPGDALIDTLFQTGGRVTLRALADIKAVWGISIKSLVGRFHSLGVIDADHARSLYKQISARHWSTNEPVHVPTEAAQWFQRTLTLKVEASELAKATECLAARIGGNASDLFEFANWGTVPDADIISLPSRQGL